MPRSKVANKVDMRCLTVVYSVKVIVAVDRVQCAVVGELLLRDCWVILQAKDSIDVVFPLVCCQFAPMCILVSNCCECRGSISLIHHSFLILGFLQHSVSSGAGCDGSSFERGFDL